MNQFEKNKFIYSGVFPFLFVLILWIIKLIEIEYQLNFVSYGIFPRTINGLKGVLLAPFIHGSWHHLFNNSIPLIILGWAVFYFYRDLALKVIFWSFLLSGFYTWISARSAFHIGASGVVYSLFGFLMISGFLRKYIPLIAVSFLVAFLYGSMIWGIMPWDKSISWEGHFWGLLVGLTLAFIYRKQGPQKKEFIWPEEQDGNDEEWLVDEFNKEEESSVNVSNTLNSTHSTEIIFHYIPKNRTKS